MIGIGFDIHRLTKGRPLILGGIRIKYPKGLVGHSDADALLHALIDAILGAVKSGDIGDLFPDTDPRYKGISSAILLHRTITLIRSRHKRFVVKGVDSIIFAQEPKLGKTKSRIKNNIARLMGIKPDKVNIKAKTMEGLGPIGNKKAIAALVLVDI
ncbi:MAG: 2-C-methyl-D-erythritol 2,4-cyclodiphosphate synthase [Planctomycetes bacterium]|nr:2-C-methyl-D-erythritol 2,4-cyclodiphosphate synthase [Planctomycetota bacterium]